MSGDTVLSTLSDLVATAPASDGPWAAMGMEEALGKEFGGLGRRILPADEPWRYQSCGTKWWIRARGS